jgi:precorrin-2/cobalt-factor-2 C20-methyltransferase
MNKIGKFYGIGVGPGDPELITLKAVKNLSQMDMVIAPAGKKESLALKIAGPYIKCPVKEMNFPMINDGDLLNRAWDKNVKTIEKILTQGRDTAFITLGDPMIYSTYTYILSRLEGYEAETVPGITSFCAAASRINRPIAEGDASFAVIPVKNRESVEKALKDFDSVVLMKVSRSYDDVVQALKENGFHGVLVTRCGQEGEKVEFDLDRYLGEKIDYLSLIIGRRDNL